MLDSSMMFHPLTPRESRTSILRRTTSNPHTHLISMKSSRSNLAINRTEMTRLLFIKIITRSNSLLRRHSMMTYMLRITFSQRIILIIILSHNLLEFFNRINLLLFMIHPYSVPYSISSENVMSTAVIVIDIRGSRLSGITRLLIDLTNVRNVVRSPITLLINHAIIHLHPCTRKE